MVETEPTVSKQNMAAKVPVKEDRARTLDQLAIPLAGELRKHSELWLSLPIHPMMLVVSPLTALIEDQMRSCEVLWLSKL